MILFYEKILLILEAARFRQTQLRVRRVVKADTRNLGFYADQKVSTTGFGKQLRRNS